MKPEKILSPPLDPIIPCINCGDPSHYSRPTGIPNKKVGICRDCNNSESKIKNLPKHSDFSILQLANLYKSKIGNQIIKSIFHKDEGGIAHIDNFFICDRGKEPTQEEMLKTEQGKRITQIIRNSKDQIRKDSENDQYIHRLSNLAFCRALSLKLIHPEYNKQKVWNIYKEKIEKGQDYEVDHIIPLNHGGWHHQDNLQVIPKDLNREKSDSLTFTHPLLKHWTSLPYHLFHREGLLWFIEQQFLIPNMNKIP